MTLSLIITLSISGCSSNDSVEEQKKFDEFMSQEFIDILESNYSDAHTLLVHPEKHGVDTSKIDKKISEDMNETVLKNESEKHKKSAENFEKFNRMI